MITNIVLGLILIFLTITLFLQMHISEDKRYDIYTKMEDDIEKKLENKPGVYKFFYILIFHVI